jgi:hypothetical protein
MTDQELKDLVAGLAVQSAKTEAQMAQTDAKIAALSERTDAKIDKLQEAILSLGKQYGGVQETISSIGKQLGGIGDNQGAVAEEFFYNSLADRPSLGGISFDRVLKNIGAGKPGNQVEFDIVMHNGAAMAIVEVKYKVHPSSLDQIEKQMRRYRELFPEYKDYKLYGGVAGFSVPDDVVEQAHERGLFVLKRKGDVVETDAEAMRAF